MLVCFGETKSKKREMEKKVCEEQDDVKKLAKMTKIAEEAKRKLHARTADMP